MSKIKPKTTDALMKYLRDVKGIAIAGSSQKRKLRYIGYYHAYKGYRYINKASNQVHYSNFDELVAVYDFDAQIKALFYPYVMQIETAFKNYVLEVIVHEVHSESFIDIYNSLLINYMSFSTLGKRYPDTKSRERAEKKYHYELQKRLELRNRVYSVQTNAFSNGNNIANHYLQNDVSLPIWGIFELLSLGEFGHFVSCLNYSCRRNISKSLSIHQSDDSNAMLPQRLIYATKDLRNAIAHNDVVFDARFKTGKIDKQVGNAIANVSGVSALSFETVTDYLALIVYQLKLLKNSKTEIKRLITNYTEIVERLRNNVPTNIFNQIIHTDNNTKVKRLKTFASA